MRVASGLCVGLLLGIWGSQAVNGQTTIPVTQFVIAARTVTLVGDVPPPIASPKVRDLVAQILDERISATNRHELIKRNPELAGELILGLTDQLTPGTPEEYRRIPWIWQIAIETGKQNNPVIIRAVLEVALPEPNQPLHDWRAAVIGGGIISGIGQQGLWPRERMEEILLDQQELLLRWQMAIKEAANLVEDEKEPVGARYDAMRILGLSTWDRYGPQLTRYLQPGVHPDLQRGAVCALADMDHAGAVTALVKGLGHYSEKNRHLALEGLLHGQVRQKTLIEGLEQGMVRPTWITVAQREKLLQIDDQTWRARAEQIFTK